VSACFTQRASRTESYLELGRLLVVVELVVDLNEDAWNRLYSTSRRCLPRGTKIIVTNRSDKPV
jgi:hypothetical protein